MAESLGGFRLGMVHNLDCLEATKRLPDDSVPMIWTDPPYGHRNNDGGDLIQRWECAMPDGRKVPPALRNADLARKWEWVLGHESAGQCAERDARPIANDDREGRDRVVKGMLAEAGRVLRKDCCCCCCCGGGGPDPLFARAALEMDEPPLEFFHAVVWDKGGLGMGWRYRRNYEFVLVAKRRGGKLLWATESSGPETANVVRIGKIIPSAEQHPTQKPVALVEHFLRLHTKEGDLVLDPFAGSGTTGEVALRLGRQVIGFDLNPEYCKALAAPRLEAAQRGLTVAEHRMGQETLFAPPESP